jgi:hypothetical protein
MALVLQVVLKGNVNRRVHVVGRALLGMCSPAPSEFTADGEIDFVLAQRIFNAVLVPAVGEGGVILRV